MAKIKFLGKRLKPVHYSLYIDTTHAAHNFLGRLQLQAKITNTTKTLILHAHELEVGEATVNGRPSQVEYDAKSQTLSLKVEREVPAGVVDIHIEYIGKIRDQLHGLYRSHNKTTQGGKEPILVTQLESHHARELLPCIDEPNAKATFQLTLVAPQDITAISNTEIINKKELRSSTEITFETTPLMSTYLLAFVIGDLSYLEARSKSGILVRTWAVPEKHEQTAFALDVAVRTFDFFEEYFAIPFPLKKCDLIAVPDFSAGAMENWGCITFRETALLRDEHTSQTGKQWLAETVSHELAHQWFGNLVTMDWWTDLWLNEGFASWIANLAIDELFPEWNIWTEFILNDTFRAQSLDALTSSHPVEVTVDDPEQIRSIFDAISYSKGGSLLRMLHAYLGAESFQKGLQHYLKKHSYANATTADLWDSLEHASAKPVKQFMYKWTSTTGFPVISISIDEKQPGATLRQQTFSLPPRTPSKHLWPVPIASHANDDTIFDSRETQLESYEPTMLLNTGRTGFYYTAYPPRVIEEVSTILADNKPIDRLGLLHETSQLVKADRQSIELLMKMLGAYQSEKSAFVWSVIANVMSDIRRVLIDDNDEMRSALKTFTRSLISEQLHSLAFNPSEGEDHNTTLLRPTILGLGSWSEAETVVQWASQEFGSDNIHPDIISVVYGTIARTGGAKEFEWFLERHKQSTSSQEIIKLTAALCSFSQPSLNRKALELIKSAQVRNQDVYYWIAYLFGNRYAKHFAWDWLKKEWPWLQSNFGSDIVTLSAFPKMVAGGFSKTEHLAEFSNFFDAQNVKSIEMQIEQAKETIAWQTEWRQRDAARLEAWLNAQSIVE